MSEQVRNTGTPEQPFLYVVVCAAGVASGVSKLITAAQERGWAVGVFATPVALNGFFDTDAVRAQTGRPIRSAWRRPGEPRPFPDPDAVVVAPATFNTVNKWAAGLADNLALATLCEVSGLGVPVAVLPCVADALASHPAYRESLARLRGMGVRFGDPYAGQGRGRRPPRLRLGAGAGPGRTGLTRRRPKPHRDVRSPPVLMIPKTGAATMRYVKLGSTGLEVSRICLGCMTYGVPDRGTHAWTLDAEASRPLIRQALEAGVTFFDTANVYSDGTSEEIVGEALRDYARRDDIVLATKVNGRMRPGPNGAGLSRKAIMTEIDHSLRRLGTDYVDLYQIHRFDPHTPVEETMEALHDLVRAGKVRYIGASSMYAWQFSKMQYTAERHGWTKFVSMQNHYNLLYREGGARDAAALRGPGGRRAAVEPARPRPAHP